MLPLRRPAFYNSRCSKVGQSHRPCTSSSTAATTTVDLKARQKKRYLAEISESGKKVNRVFDQTALQDGLLQLEALLPGPPTFEINLESMKASDWGIVLLDAPMVAMRIVQLKTHFPAMNLSKVVAKRPMLLLRTPEEIDKDAIAVKKLLERANNVDKLLEEVPQLLSPKSCLSAIVTINKWFQLKEDPIAVLERDPDIIRRAQDNDAPFEPVYEDADGNWTAPQLNYREKRADWQKYIDQTRYKQP